MTQSSSATVQPAGPEIQTPANVADLATEKGVLPLDQLVLIGTFGTPDNRGALLLTARGRVIRVRKGDVTAAGRIVGIEAGTVVLHRRGRTVNLSMPG